MCEFVYLALLFPSCFNISTSVCPHNYLAEDQIKFIVALSQSDLTSCFHSKDILTPPCVI